MLKISQLIVKQNKKPHQKDEVLEASSGFEPL